MLLYTYRPSGAWREKNPQLDFQELKNSVTTRIYKVSISSVNPQNWCRV